MAKTIIKTDAEALLPELRKALLIVPKNSPMPILQNFLLDFRKGKSFVVATDLAQFFKAKIEASAEEELSFLVPAHLFTDLIGTLSGELTFEVMKTKAVIKSSNGQYSLSISDSEDYPEQPKPKKANAIVYSDVLQEVFINVIDDIEYAISKEDLRPAMCGVLIEPDKNAKFVSTDGHMLSLRRAPIGTAGSGEGFIIPSESLSIMKKILPDKFDLTLSEGRAFVISDNINYATRLIGEKYPKYEAVIPKDNDKEATVKREEFIKVIKRLRLFKEEKGSAIVLSFIKDGIVLKVQNKTIGAGGEEQIDAKHNLPDDFKLAFNPDYLLQTAHSFNTQEVKLTFSTPTKAMIMLDPEKPENISLVMPTREPDSEIP